MQDFGDRTVTLGMHSSWSIARKGAKIIGMRVQFCLACIAGEIIVVERLPPFFFVLFVAFVVKNLVAAAGCSKYSVVSLSPIRVNSCSFVV